MEQVENNVDNLVTGSCLFILMWQCRNNHQTSKSGMSHGSEIQALPNSRTILNERREILMLRWIIEMKRIDMNRTEK